MRRSKGTALKNLFSLVLALSAGRPVFTADYYFVDGVTGKVASFIDWNDATHLLAQSTGTYQVAQPTSRSDFGGALCASFSSHVYQSNRPTSSWIMDHDGVDTEFHAVISPTASSGTNVIGVTVLAGNNRGVQLYYAGGGSWTAYLGTTGGSSIAVTTFGTAIQNTPTFMHVRTKAADSPDYEFRLKAALNASGNYAVAPSGLAATLPFLLGAGSYPTPSSAPGSFWFNAFLFTPALSASQRSTVDAWILQKTGLS